MKAHFGKFAVAVMAGSLVLGGCATTGSVKRAQARADQGFVEGQKGQADAARAQGTAEGAGAAASRAQGSADAAGAAAQSAGAAAQGANAAVGSLAQETNQKYAALNGRLHRLEAAEWKRHHKAKPKKKHHTSHVVIKKTVEAQ